MLYVLLTIGTFATFFYTRSMNASLPGIVEELQARRDPRRVLRELPPPPYQETPEQRYQEAPPYGLLEREVANQR